MSIFTCFCVLLLVLPAARAQGSYGFPQQPSGSAPPPPPPPPYDYRSQPQHMPGGQYFPYESAQQGRAPPTPPHMMQPQFPGQAKPYEAQKPGESIWQRIGQRLFQGDGAHQPPPRRPPQYTGVPHSMSHQQRPLPPQNRMVSSRERTICDQITSQPFIIISLNCGSSSTFSGPAASNGSTLSTSRIR